VLLHPGPPDTPRRAELSGGHWSAPDGITLVSGPYLRDSGVRWVRYLSPFPTIVLLESTPMMSPEDERAMTRRVLRKLDSHILPPLALVLDGFYYLAQTLTSGFLAMARQLHRQEQYWQCKVCSPRNLGRNKTDHPL